MPRKPLDASDETVRLTIRLTHQQAATLDELRGSRTRSAYLRGLIESGMTTQIDIDQPVEKPKVKVVPAGRHLHHFVKDQIPTTYNQKGMLKIPIYRSVCECGEIKMGQ